MEMSRGIVDCLKIWWVEGRPRAVQRCEGEGMEGEKKGRGRQGADRDMEGGISRVHYSL